MVALKTFNNLSPERQTEIILVCLEEFALSEYQSASLSAIVSKLKLAKGSFYRYFESKSSLYYFLFDYCFQCRIKNDKVFIDNTTSDFFELMQQHFVARLHFDKKFPLQSAFLYNALRERNNDELGDIQFKSKAKFREMAKQMVVMQIKNKVLRKDIDIDLLSFMITQTNSSIADYISLKYDIDFRENIRNKKSLFDLPEKEIIKISKQFIEILKTGIKNK